MFLPVMQKKPAVSSRIVPLSCEKKVLICVGSLPRETERKRTRWVRLQTAKSRARERKRHFVAD